MLPDFRVRQRDYLLEISRALTQELDLEKLLARILRIAIEMLAGQAGLIALKEDGWRVAAAHGIATNFLSYLTPLLSEENVRELNVNELNRMLKELTYTASMGLLNGTALPLATHGQVIGVIFIFRSYTDLFTPNDRVLLQSFADQAAIAVFNARLYGQVSYEKQRLDALLDSAADGILILHADLSIERVNDAFERIYGQTHDELVSLSHDDVIRWEHPPQGSTLNEAIANGWPLTPNATLYVEGDLERPLPPALPVGITYAPLLSGDGKLRNIIVSVRDITHFRTADEVFLADMGYQHVVLVEGNDMRGIDVGLLSRIPVGEVRSNRHIRFSGKDGVTSRFQRDVVEVTLEPDDGEPFAVWVVHLKSNSGGREEAEPIRLPEAQQIRNMLDAELAEDPNARIIVTGDFNDTWESRTIQTIVGSSDAALFSAGSESQDPGLVTYDEGEFRSVIDFLLCTPAMARQFVKDSYRNPQGSVEQTGSDLNPIAASFRTK
jgi:PAS domain-containing protein